MSLTLWFFAVFALGMMFGSAWDEDPHVGFWIGLVLLVLVSVFATGAYMATP